MRKITEEAVAAFLSGRNYKKDNTMVQAPETIGSVKIGARMYLHGNQVAYRKAGTLRITTSGWDTTTTKERLNGLPGVSVHHSKHQLYLNGKEWDGSWITV